MHLIMQKFYTLCFLCLNLLFVVNPIKSQVSDDFSDFNLNLNPTWLGNDSFFQVNLNQQLQSNAIVGSSGEIFLCIPFENVSKEFEWRTDYRFAFNPSSQNHFKFYLFADSFNLLKSNQALYLQFGGSTGSTDSLLLVQINQSQKNILARGRPSTLGKTNSVGALLVQLDSNNILSVFLDTSSANTFIKEMEWEFPIRQSGFYSGYSFRYTSGNIKNFYADNFYLGPILRDTIPPVIVKSSMSDPNQILIGFNEKLDTIKGSSLVQIQGDTEFLNFVYQDDLKSILVLLNQTIEDSLFQLNLKGFKDIYGNTIADTIINCWYHQIKKQELVFSELMIDPDPSKGLPNAEYIEIYNRSQFTLEVNGLKLTDGSSTATLPDILIQPKEFVLFYAIEDTALFRNWKGFGLANFPTLNNSSDHLELLGKNNFLIDEISYDENFLSLLSISEGGQSISLNYPNQLCKGNVVWSSSVELIGGSPGAKGINWDESYDLQAPQLIKSDLLDSMFVLLVFNEPCLKGNLKYFSGVDTLLANCKWFSQSSDSFLYEWKPLYEREKRQFKLSDFKDCSGNASLQTAEVFYMQFKPVLANELLITEILFDTDDDNEFIELYNRSNHLIQLNNLVLKRGSFSLKLPTYSLYPDSFVVLTKTHHDEFVNELISSNFPTLYLSDSLFLFDENGFRIHEIFYHPGAYHDEFKKQQKSWSIEMIDFNNPCAEMDNWSACKGLLNKHSAGLTNTVKAENSDIKRPHLLRMYTPSNHELCFYFSEEIDSLSLGFLNHSFWDINKFSYKGNRQILSYQTDSVFKTSNTYQFHISGLRDCVNHEILDTLIEFSLPVYDSLALVLNEVLFNPKPNASDFIELYNRSESFIDLKDYFLATAEQEGINFKELLPVFKDGYLMAPQTYLIISPEDQTSFFKNLLEHQQLINKIPAMPDDGIYLYLLDKNGQSIEGLHVSPDLHFTSITDVEGVSLERLSPYSGVPNNWTSGAAFCDYVSPGRKNCMSIQENQVKETLYLNQKVISPDGDGFQDFLQIDYEFERNDISMSVFILDEMGNKIKQLANALRVGYSGFLIWDGTDEQGRIPPEGIYLVRQEYYTTNGEYKVVQKPLVIARRERLN